jgi:hypothetical protein
MNKDLFECPNKLPSKIQVILRRFNDLEIKRGIQMPTSSKWARKWLKMGIVLIFTLIAYLIILKK